MSEYGANIILSKKEDSPLTREEKDLVKAELRRLKKEHSFSDILDEPFLYEAHEIKGDNKSMHLIFSEYWDGDGGDDDDFDFARDNDLKQVEEIAELLKPALGAVFEFEVAFERW